MRALIVIATLAFGTLVGVVAFLTFSFVAIILGWASMSEEPWLPLDPYRSIIRAGFMILGAVFVSRVYLRALQRSENTHGNGEVRRLIPNLRDPSFLALIAAAGPSLSVLVIFCLTPMFDYEPGHWVVRAARLSAPFLPLSASAVAVVISAREDSNAHGWVTLWGLIAAAMSVFLHALDASFL